MATISQYRFSLILFLLLALPVEAQSADGPPYAVKAQFNVHVRMRDGVGLATHIYRPDAEGRFPVILVRNPYGNGSDTTSVNEGREWAKRGYAFVFQGVRGRYDSEGHYYPYLYEMNDGYDTQQWAGTQSWSNGKIGTTGGSYLAAVQWLPAPLNSPYLRAMMPSISPFNYYFDVMYQGGAFALASRLGWGAGMAARTGLAFRHDYQSAFRHLPLRTMDEALGLKINYWQDWIGHPNYDAYWQVLDTEAKVGEIDVPSLNIGGWFDVFQRGTLNSYMKMRSSAKTPQARSGQKLIIGPWIHGPFGAKSGDLTFGPGAVLDTKTLSQRWFDYWLAGIDTGVMTDAHVRLFVMGDNVWRDEQDWPLARTQYTKFYFHSQGPASEPEIGMLDRRPPRQERSEIYVYDPENPVPTKGGNLLGGGGPFDQSGAAPRPDVLRFTTPVLETDIEVTGPVKVVLYASSSAQDTDFTAKLLDVYPDGKAYNLLDGIIRARYRESFTEPTLIEPNKIYAYTIELWATSNVFKQGHRIRVDVSSSNFPRYDRNPNTGHPFGMDAELAKATQTVYHDAQHPSHILLPMIPR